MPSIYGLKPKFQALLRPIVNWLARIGVTANQVTIAALLLSLTVGHIIHFNHGGRWLLLLPAGDVVADIGLYFPLVFVPGFDPRLIAAIVLLSVLTEMTGVIGVQIGASRRYDGPLGKSDRAFVFGL